MKIPSSPSRPHGLRATFPRAAARRGAAVALALLAPLYAAAAPQAPVREGASAADRVQASPLLAIDRNRATVIDRIVGQWGSALTRSGAGLDDAQLRVLLDGMRADQLLAASLAGSLEGLRDVIANAVAAEEREVKASLLPAKALGDTGTDVVYVPVTPCRLVDTRTSYPAVYQGAGPFSDGDVRTYTVEGGNRVCLSQLPASARPAAVQLQVFGSPTAGGSGDIEIVAQGTRFGRTATLAFTGNVAISSNGTTAPVNLTNKQIAVQVRGALANVSIDVVGYYRAPQGGFVSSVTAGAGLRGGGTGGDATLDIDPAYVQRRVAGTCAVGAAIRAVREDGTVQCQLGNAGTVTSVATGTGLTGGPITGAGTVSIANGGVGTDQLADGSVTQAKRAALGAEYATQLGATAVQATVTFLAPVVTVLLTEPRPVLVTSGKALGSTAAGGGTGLSLFICYQQGADPITIVGYGAADLRTPQNSRNLYSQSAVITSLGAGAYVVGLCGNSSAPASWNDFEYGYTTAVIL